MKILPKSNQNLIGSSEARKSQETNCFLGGWGKVTLGHGDNLWIYIYEWYFLVGLKYSHNSNGYFKC